MHLRACILRPYKPSFGLSASKIYLECNVQHLPTTLSIMRLLETWEKNVKFEDKMIIIGGLVVVVVVVSLSSSSSSSLSSSSLSDLCLHFSRRRVKLYSETRAPLDARHTGRRCPSVGRNQ